MRYNSKMGGVIRRDVSLLLENGGWVSSLIEFYSSGVTGPIHTLGGVACYVSNGTEKNIRLQFNLVYSSGFTGPLYFDVTESPSRHCQ
jgi:hypothetical protein